MSVHQDLARAQVSARVADAAAARRSHQLARAVRLTRRAEQAAQQARVALARAL